MRGGSVFKSVVAMTGLVASFAVTPVYALDPTLPPVGRSVNDVLAEEAVANLHLQAIFRVSGRASAVINGQTLQVGGRIGDAQLVELRPHSVVIDRHGQQQELHLSAPIIQTSRTQP